ncbi:hypothetical protein Tco_0484020 [Tanacetum coccineum]
MNLKRRNRRRSKQRVEPFALEETPVVTMADQRTMAELLRAPTEGYAKAIFSTLKYKDVLETSIKLMLFPFSIDGPARIWLDKEPSHSILTWDDLISIFKDLLRACPHHGFTELHQLNTFYNGLNPSDQDSLNSAAGGNLLERSAQDVLKIIENKSKVHNSRNKPIVSQVKASNVDSSEIASAVASAVTSSMAVMFKQHQCPATDGNTFSGYQDNIQGYVSAAATNYNQGNTGYQPQSVANQFQPPGFTQPNVQNQGFNQNRGNNFNQGNSSYQALIQTQVTTSSDLDKFKKTNEASMQATRNHISNLKSELRNEMQSTMQNQNNTFKNEMRNEMQVTMSNQTNELKNMMASFFLQNNNALLLWVGDQFLAYTVANPRGDLLLLEKLLNDDPSSPLPPKELHVEELKIVKSSIDDPPELELKDLPSHLEIAWIMKTLVLVVLSFIHSSFTP